MDPCSLFFPPCWMSPAWLRSETCVPLLLVQWGLGSILQGLLSFMLEDAIGAGGMVRTPSQRRTLASQSLAYNRRDNNFCKLFPELLEDEALQQQAQQPLEQQRPQSQSAVSAWVAGLHYMRWPPCQRSTPSLPPSNSSCLIHEQRHMK